MKPLLKEDLDYLQSCVVRKRSTHYENLDALLDAHDFWREVVKKRHHGLLLRTRPDINGTVRTFDRNQCDWSDDCTPETCPWVLAQ